MARRRSPMLSIRDHHLEHLVVRGTSSEVWSALRLGPGGFAVPIARDVAAGLEAIHEAGLVHRNVAPDNLMLAASGRAVIIDFGCAAWHLAERVRSTPPTVALDLPYASPELRGRLPVDPRTDVY